MLHSPGGSAEAVDSIVALLRSRFTDIRFIVPSVAKSAATMLAMSGNRIIMDEISELGPIDPQLIINRGGQTIVAPLQSIRDQFLRAQEELAQNPEKLPSWMPILQQYGPSLLVECDNRIELARSLVERWLRDYMFVGESDAQDKAATISTFLADDKNFLSHARRVGIDELRAHGVKVDDMRATQALREAVHELYIATMLTFQGTGAVKIFENSRDQGLLTVMQSHIVQPQPAPPTTGAPEPSPPPRPRTPAETPRQGSRPASRSKRKRR